MSNTCRAVSETTRHGAHADDGQQRSTTAAIDVGPGGAHLGQPVAVRPLVCGRDCGHRLHASQPVAIAVARVVRALLAESAPDRAADELSVCALSLDACHCDRRRLCRRGRRSRGGRLDRNGDPAQRATRAARALRRYQALANAAGTLATGDEGDAASNILPKAIAASVLKHHEAEGGTIRVRALGLPDIDEVTSLADIERAARDNVSTVYEAQVIVGPTSVELLRKSTTLEAAPVESRSRPPTTPRPSEQAAP